VLTQTRRKVKELETAYDELVQNQLRLQGEAVLEERARLAREVHDTVSRSLTGIIVTTESLERRAVHGKIDLAQELTAIKEQARLGLRDTRQSLSKLRPTISPIGEVTSSLRALADQVERWYDVKVEVSITVDSSRISADYEPVLLRLVQEAVTNSIRHGKATSLKLTLSDMSKMLELKVEDNGSGCTELKLGYGLTGMSERIEAVGGTVAFASVPGKGFTITALFPEVS